MPASRSALPSFIRRRWNRFKSLRVVPVGFFGGGRPDPAHTAVRGVCPHRRADERASHAFAISAWPLHNRLIGRADGQGTVREAMAEWAEKLAGKFIVVDGPDGGGKSTQIARLADWLDRQGVSVVRAHDPGGTLIGDRVREILLDPSAKEMASQCETMLYMASRAQLVAEVIRPALADGRCVLCDRFISATIAYQGAGGVEPAKILLVGEVAVGHTCPDLTIILDIDPRAGLARVKGDPDRMEAKDLAFHRRVREGFLRQAADSPDRFAIVDGAGGISEVAKRLQEKILAWRW